MQLHDHSIHIRCIHMDFIECRSFYFFHFRAHNFDLSVSYYSCSLCFFIAILCRIAFYLALACQCANIFAFLYLLSSESTNWTAHSELSLVISVCILRYYCRRCNYQKHMPFVHVTFTRHIRANRITNRLFDYYCCLFVSHDHFVYSYSQFTTHDRHFLQEPASHTAC